MNSLTEGFVFLMFYAFDPFHTSTPKYWFPAIGLAQLLQKHEETCHHNHL